jgi:hypothetical protein
VLAGCCGVDVALPLVLAMLRRIDALFRQITSCITSSARICQANLWIRADSEQVLLPVKPELPAPQLAT